MSKSNFCEQCPLRPSDDPDIEFGGLTYVNYESRLYMGRGPVSDAFYGKVGLVFDKAGNPSWPIVIPKDFDTEDVIDFFEAKTAACDGPTIHRERTANLFFNKWEEKRVCPALGSLAVGNKIALGVIIKFADGLLQQAVSQEMHKAIAEHRRENQE